jgi:hypothetical protein
LEKIGLLSEFIRCDWCSSRPREQAIIYSPYQCYLCLDHFHAWDKRRKQSRSYKQWAAKKKAEQEAEQLREQMERNI